MKTSLLFIPYPHVLVCRSLRQLLNLIHYSLPCLFLMLFWIGLCSKHIMAPPGNSCSYASMLSCLLDHPSLSVPNTAGIGFTGSHAKIDLWWIKGATGATHLGWSCLSCLAIYFGAEFLRSGRRDPTWCFLPLFELESDGYTGDLSRSLCFICLQA